MEGNVTDNKYIYLIPSCLFKVLYKNIMLNIHDQADDKQQQRVRSSGLPECTPLQTPITAATPQSDITKI